MVMPSFQSNEGFGELNFLALFHFRAAETSFEISAAFAKLIRTANFATKRLVVAISLQ